MLPGYPAGVAATSPPYPTRKLSRKVRETRSSSSQKRSEPAAMRGQGGNEHGGSPWFQGEVEPGRAPAGEGRELLTPWGDERVRSLSHCGTGRACGRKK